MKKSFIYLCFCALFISTGHYAQAVNISELVKQNDIMGWSTSWKAPLSSNLRTVCAQGCDYTDPREAIIEFQTLNSNTGPSSTARKTILMLPGTYDLFDPANTAWDSLPLTQVCGEVDGSGTAGDSFLNWRPNLSEAIGAGYVVKNGSYFTLDGYIYRVTADATTDSNSKMTLSIYPNLITTVDSSNSIECSGIETIISNIHLKGVSQESVILRSTKKVEDVTNKYHAYVIFISEDSSIKTSADDIFEISNLTLAFESGSTPGEKWSHIYIGDRGVIETINDGTIWIHDIKTTSSATSQKYGVAIHTPDFLSNADSGNFVLTDSELDGGILITNALSIYIARNRMTQVVTDWANAKGIDIYYDEDEMTGRESDLGVLGKNIIRDNYVYTTAASGATKIGAGITFEQGGQALSTSKYITYINNSIFTDMSGTAEATADGYGLYIPATPFDHLWLMGTWDGPIPEVTGSTGGSDATVFAGLQSSSSFIVSDDHVNRLTVRSVDDSFSALGFGEVNWDSLVTNPSAASLNFPGLPADSTITVWLEDDNNNPHYWMNGKVITITSVVSTFADADCTTDPDIQDVDGTSTMTIPLTGGHAPFALDWAYPTNCSYTAGDTVVITIQGETIFGQTLGNHIITLTLQ